MDVEIERNDQYTADIEVIKTKIIKGVETNSEKVKEYCLELFDLASKNQDTFNIGFSHIYLANYYLTIAYDIDLVDKYLNLAYSNLKDSNDKIMLKYYNMKAVVYEKADDAISMLKCLLSILKVTKETGDESYLATYFGSIGHLFKECKDYDEAIRYLELADFEFNKQENKLEDSKYLVNAVNLLEGYCAANKEKQAKEFLNKIEAVHDTIPFKGMLLVYSKMLYATMRRNKREIVNQAKQLLDLNILQYENTIWRYQLMRELIRCLLIAKNEKYLELIFDDIDQGNQPELAEKVDIQKYRLEFHKLFEAQENQQLSYKEFYTSYQKYLNIRNSNKIATFANLFQVQTAIDHQNSIKKDNLSLEREVMIDDLSGLYNRRYLDVLKTECRELTKEQSFAIALVDIDYFKEYNDNYGHIQGDEVIRQVSDSLKKFSTDQIVACRYGGDEFFVICRNATEKIMEEYIRKVMDDLRGKQITHAFSKCANFVTISIGYYLGKVDRKTDIVELIDFADQSIYMSKRSGRNTFTKYKSGGEF